MKYPPTVKINGVTLACEFTSQGDAVVMDDLRVSWGRDALYDPTNPSELRIDLIDPDGLYASDPALFGAKITVETELGVLFRGEIDGISIAPGEIDDPDPSVPNDVWIVSLSASDVIAKLAKLVAPGYEHTVAAVALQLARNAYGAGWWTYADTESRRVQIQRRMSERGIPTKVETNDLATMAPGGLRTYAHYFREPITHAGPDLYELVRSVQLRGNRPQHTNYLAATDTLRSGDWARSSTIELYYANSIIGVRLDQSNGAAFTVDCTKIVVADPGAVLASVTHNVSSLRITEYVYGTETRTDPGPPSYTGGVQLWTPADVDTAVATPGGGTSQWELPCYIGNWNVTYTDSGSQLVQSQTAAEFAALLAPYVAAVNGKLVPPDFIFDIENESFPAAIESALLSTWTITTPWAFPGSKYEALIGFGPVFQHIGGELRFRRGWEVTGRFAPGITSGTGLAINALITNPTPTFDQYAPAVTLATLGIVTKGIS